MPKIHTDRIDVLTLFTYVLLIGYVVNARIQRLIYVIQTSQIVIRLSIKIQNNWTRMECMGTRDIIIATDIPVAGGGGTRHMKGVGMLVVSLTGVNFGFWCHLGCSGQIAIIFSREGLV